MPEYGIIVMRVRANKDGFALIEVLIAMVVFAVGVLAIAQLQYRAILQNSSAFTRTRAVAVALAVMEELKRLPFDDANLAGSGNLDAGWVQLGSDPIPADADHVFDPAAMPVLGNTLQVDGNDILDGSGRLFQLFWNVQPNTVTIGTDTSTPTCTIRLFVYWDSPLGKNHLEMTTVKANV